MRFWKDIPPKALWVAFFSVIGIGAFLYLGVGRSVKLGVTEQLLNKQQILVRAEVGNITSFFQAFGDSIAVLSKLKTITSSTSAIWELDAFIEQWRDNGLIGGIALTDKNGVVRLNSNTLGTRDTGVSLADRDYFLWAKGGAKRGLPAGRQGEYFIGKPIVGRGQSTEGQIIVPVAAPVYQNNVFTGVLVASVKLNNLTQKFLELMKVSDETSTYLIDQDEELLYGTSLSADIKSAINMANEGKVKTSKYLVAYSPVLLGSQSWLLVMTSPAKEVTGITAPIYARSAALVLLVSLTIFTFGGVAVREVKSDQKSS